jgi:hypothetical protein
MKPLLEVVHIGTPDYMWQPFLHKDEKGKLILLWIATILWLDSKKGSPKGEGHAFES